MRLALASLALTTALFSAAPARASVALAMSVEQLTGKADLVVRAHVTGQETIWNRGGRIVTTVHLAVDAALKGDAPKTLDVRHWGGRVGNLGQQVEGEVSFAPDEEVVVFVRAHPTARGLYQVVGMAQGKFHVERTAQGATAKQKLDGLGLVQKPGGAIEDLPGDALPLETLQLRVAKAAKP